MGNGRIDEINFYRARAMEMIQKAQSAPTETIRQAYLSLAQKWTQQADSLWAKAKNNGGEPPPASGEGDPEGKKPLP